MIVIINLYIYYSVLYGLGAFFYSFLNKNLYALLEAFFFVLLVVLYLVDIIFFFEFFCSGISRINQYEIRTTTTGLSTSHSFLFLGAC